MTFNDFWNDYKKDLTNKEQIEIALDAWSAGVNSIRAEKLVSPKTADDSNKIRWFMELALKMRETGYSDASIYSIDTDAWDEYRVDDELTPEKAITEEESNG